LYNQAIQIADEIGNTQFQNVSRTGLASAYLYSGDLSAARAAAEAAKDYDVSQNNHYLLALLGVIALRQEDIRTAKESFAMASAQADALLVHNTQNYGALDTKGLAMCGLTRCVSADHLAAAIETYRAARVINSDTGMVGRVLRLFDALALTDTKWFNGGRTSGSGWRKCKYLRLQLARPWSYLS
jgi:hypothetical protein